VWAVLAFDNSTVITGCADKNIRVFKTSGQLVRTIKGSTDVVRALCRLPAHQSNGAVFASAGNDAIVRLWSLEGRVIAQLHGHENFIYSLTCLPTGELVSSSEDRTVRIWRDNRCVQTITHPAISVWSVACDSNTGDIVTGASDRIVRVFSRHRERQASPEELKAFDDSVKASAIPQQQMGEINKEKLPGPEFLQTKSGTKEGQVQMIREDNGNITAHQWSTAAHTWLNVGTVVDAAGTDGRKKEYHGQDYDYVFDVDIEDGKPPLKLPFNASQNPYEAAQKFIGDNELPVTYLDQVANFIISNTSASTIGQTSDAPSGGADPWGQESRYRPGEGGSNTSPPRAQARAKVLPQKEYLTIATANFSMVRKKIEEVNQTLISQGRKDVSFSPSELQTLPFLTSTLESTLSSSGDKTSDAAVLITGILIATKISTLWPPAARIPGLDLLRCLAAASPAIARSHDGAGLLSVLTSAGALAAPSDANANPNMTMLGVRALANIFAHDAGRIYAVNEFDAIHALVAPHLQPAAAATNRNIHIAATTLYINYAVAFASVQGVEPGDRVARLVSDLVALLGNRQVVDSEALYRGLVGLGSLLAVDGAAGQGISKLDVRVAVQKAGEKAKEPRVKAVVDEIKAMLV